MLTSVARKISVPVAKLSRFPSSVVSFGTRTVTGVDYLSVHRVSRPVTSAPWKAPEGKLTRAFSLSACSRGDVDPLGSLSSSADRGRFGSLSADMSSRRLFRKTSPELLDSRHQEVEEEDSEKHLSRTVGRNTPYWYFLQCKKLIKDNKLQGALDLFARDMLQLERLQPEEYNYSVLIGGCGRAGRLKQAFRLYNDMKKRGLDASDATYTALFNACAECRSKQVGLQQALKLEQELRRKKFPLSTITYHALLKTHAITNQLQGCIHTFREMLQNGHVATQETFHYLLMGCVNDKEIGFRLALQVWRQMLRSGILPDSKNYNLLLRAARDCGIGDPALASGVLLRTEPKGQVGAAHTSDPGCKVLIDVDLLERQLFSQPDPHSDSQLDGRGSEDQSHGGRESTSLIPVRQMERLLPGDTAPNLLELFQGTGGGVVSFGTVSGASDRLALIGGGEGVLEKMAADGLTPDLRTLTLLADTMEPGLQSLQMLLKVAEQHQVKLDVAFFNSVIRRAARTGDLEGAKAVLSVMQRQNVNVDVQTFGSLALVCDQLKDGLQLLKDMEESGLKPNVHVFSALIGRASRRLDYVYLKTILKMMRDLDVWPNEVIIRQLEFAAQYPPNYNQYKSRNNYLVHINSFRGYYQQWLHAMPAQDAEEEQAALQHETAAVKTEVVGGLTATPSNQRATARRYRSHNKHNVSSTQPAPSQQC